MQPWLHASGCNCQHIVPPSRLERAHLCVCLLCLNLPQFVVQLGGAVYFGGAGKSSFTLAGGGVHDNSVPSSVDGSSGGTISKIYHLFA